MQSNCIRIPKEDPSVRVCSQCGFSGIRFECTGNLRYILFNGRQAVCVVPEGVSSMKAIKEDGWE